MSVSAVPYPARAPLLSWAEFAVGTSAGSACGPFFMDPTQLQDAMARGAAQADADAEALAALWND